MIPPRLLLLVSRSGHTAPLQNHFWHIIEAGVFFVVTIGGIAVAEVVQKRKNVQVRNGAERSLVEDLSLTTTRSGSGGVATLPRRTVDPTEAAPMRTPRSRQTLIPLMAIASAGAAAVHFAVMPTHFREAFLYGAFFTAAALAQLAYAVRLLARPSVTLLVAGAAGSILIVALWLVTRTIGIPLGPAAGDVEAFGPLDVLASGFEVVVAGCAIAVVAGRTVLRPCLSPVTWSRWLWLAGPAMVASVVATAIASPPS